MTDHVFVAVQAYIFCPAAAFVLKNRCPGKQAAGNTVPVFIVRVAGAPEKSTFLDCVAKSTAVCPNRHCAAASRETHTTFCIFIPLSMETFVGFGFPKAV
jgi:hypothetical protein